MKPKINHCFTSGRLLGFAATIIVHIGGTTDLMAASQTWSGATDATWVTGTNWGGGAAPGSPTVSSNDVATFNSALVGGTRGGSTDPIVLDAQRIIGGLTYDTANVGAYTIGTNAGGQYQFQLTALLAGTNLTQVTTAVTSPQVIATPIYLRNGSGTVNPSYTFRNNATSTVATLSLTGVQTWNGSASRPTFVTLDGSNTGENTISGVISNPANGQGGNLLTKNGTGTWILTAANNFTGTASTGVAINGGILSARNAQALGAGSNNNKVAINSTGTLQLAGGITLIDTQRLNLNDGGTIQSSGSNTTNATVAVATAATSVTLSTANASDVFTIGNAANDFTGGTAGTSLTNVTGPGLIALAQASNYSGGWSINSGAVQIGSATALGAATTTTVTFGASSTGTLRLNALSPTIIGLTTNATPGTPVVENGTDGASLLTLNNVSDGTFAGTLRDGPAGTLALTKGGAGGLTLSGTISYTGDTIVSAGTLKINSSAATPNVSVSAGATLGGSGTIAGAVNLAPASHFAPGNSVGTLTVGSLAVASGTILDYEFNASAAPDDLTVVTAADGLTLDGGGFNLYQEGSITQFSTVGTYNLFQYSGTLGGSVSNLSVLNPNATRNYAFSADGTNVKLSITAAIISTWNLATGGSWANAGSWAGSGVPNGSGTTALFSSALTSPGTVVLNGNKTVGTVAFDNPNAYTISPATTESLVLDNTANSGNAQLIGTNGSHGITAPVVLNSNTVVSVVNSGDTITLSGIVSGDGSLSKGGPGTLALTGANTYLGSTTLSNGTISFASGGLSFGGTLAIGGGTLQWKTGNTDDISDSRTVDLLAGGATFDTNGNDVSLLTGIGNSGTGGLVKIGAGTLSLAPGSSYSGTTQVSAGTLALADDSALGSAPGAATPGSLTIGAATLAATGTFTIGANRGIALASPSSTINVAAASTLNYGGIVAGSGILNVTGTGILNLSAANINSGGTVINTGATVNLSGVGVVGTGQLTLAGGTLSINRNLFNQPNAFVGAAQTGTIDGLNDRVGLGGLTGSGTITLVTRYGGTNVGSGAFGFRLVGGSGGFTGTINLKSGTGTVNSFAAHFNGGNFEGNLSGATVNMTDHARLAGVNNSGGNTVTIGALEGDSTTFLSGADYAGTNTYSIGGKNLNTVFAGTVDNGSGGNANIIKTGTGSLTLSGTNTYFGTTTVNGGTLAVVNATSLGSDLVGTTVAGGDVDSKVTVVGALTLTEPWILSGRQGINANSPAIVNVSDSNVLSGLVTPITGGSNYNIQCSAGTLTMSGAFVPTGAVTGARYLQLLGAGNLEWSGAIQNGTAVVNVNCKEAGVRTLSGINTYTGDTTIDLDSTMVLATAGQLKFAPGANGVSNKITGSGIGTLNGAFDIDLAAANLTNGNSWLLVDVVNLAVTYGGSFTVNGFTKSGTTWTKVDGGKTWTFQQTTGQLGLVLAGYAGWAGTNAGGQLANADFDSDGVTNGVEYFMNAAAGFTANPALNGSNVISWTNGGNIAPGAYGTEYVVQTSNDLSVWVDVPVGSVTNTAGLLSYTLTGTAPRFVRLMVTPN